MTDIERHGPEAIDELEPLWLAMVAHHGTVARSMGPVRDDADTWARRRAHYAEQLGRPGAFVLVARDDGGRAIGYALVAMEGPSVTWPDPDGWAEIDSLSVLPEARGQGLGERLVARVQEEVGPDVELRLYAMAENADALRFYEREGFETAIVVLRRRAPGG